MKLTARTVGGENVRRQLAKLGQSPRRALDLLAEDVESYVEREAGKHSKSGALFASIGKRRTGPTGWIVGHDTQRAKHALFVHWGTKPHLIVPTKKKALRWARADFVGPLLPSAKGGKGRSGFVFSKGVKHPGNKADPWFVRAASQAPLMFQRHVEAIIRQRGA